MGIRIFRQALAVMVSLSVATPSWGESKDFGIYKGAVDQCVATVVDVASRCNGAVLNSAASALPVGTGTVGSVTTDTQNSIAQTNGSMGTMGTQYLACGSLFANCQTECNPGKLQPVPAPTDPEMEKYQAALKEMKDYLDQGGSKSCKYHVELAQQKIQEGILTANAGKKGMSDIWKYAAGAAVGAGAMYLLKGDGKKKDEETDEAKKAAAAKAANGVIKDSAGQEITCFSPEQVTNPTCKATLLSLCQGEKSNSAGCRTFEAGYCAGEGNGSNYCLYAETKVYCAQSGDMIASSPACAWKNARPASCTSDPEAVTCLAAGTPEALTLSCGNFPNDPLCKANSAGRVVVQGGGSAPASGTVAGTDNPTNPGTTTGSTTSPISYGSVSMSSVIGGARAPSNGSTLAVISPTDNIWSSSGSAVKQACAAGKLLNCL